jgi:hypothetical protein
MQAIFQLLSRALPTQQAKEKDSSIGKIHADSEWAIAKSSYEKDGKCLRENTLVLVCAHEVVCDVGGLKRGRCSNAGVS